MTSKPSAATAEAEIRTLIDDWANAIRTKDVNGVMAPYAADCVTYDLAPPLVSTRAEAKGLAAWFVTWRGPIGYEIRALHVTAGDDAAFCHSLARLSGTTIDDEKNDVWFRLTLGFRRIRGAWKIAHQHESVPFYMDGSYPAAVDLKP